MSQSPHVSPPPDAPLDADKQLEQLERRLGDFEKQSRRLQKLAAMGTMSAMLAHEFRNLLTPIISYATYALTKSNVELMRTALETTLKNARAATALCERITDMASEEMAGVQAAVIQRVIEEAVACLGRGLDRDQITLDVQAEPGLAARINPSALQQVLFNLILNARQAMLERPGTLTIAASRTADGRVRIAVSDTGTGIRSSDLPRVFDPFFTTKRRGDLRPDRRGLGLGLTICRQIIEEAGGTIDVASRWGEGTTFTIVLPAG